MDLNEIVNSYQSHVKIKKEQNLYRELVPSQARICFSTNDYLGLSQHPAIIAASQKACEIYGVGAQASRLLGSTNTLFCPFEKEIATAKRQESALIFASGFQTNVSVIAALLDRQILKKEPLAFCDRLNHASIHMGCAAARVRQIRYQHTDLNHLETLLKKHQNSLSPKFIFTESVFGMDGDCVDMEGLTSLSQKYAAFLYVDEAHATGVLGAHGYGLTSQWGNGVSLAMGTFSKALGSFGGYVATSNAITSYLVNRCAGFIYGTALPPPVIISAQTAWGMIPSLDKERAHIQHLAHVLKDGVVHLGLDCGTTTTHIIPIILNSSATTLHVQKALMDQGIHVSAIRPPTVPQGQARLRLALRANHTHEHVEILLKALARLL